MITALQIEALAKDYSIDTFSIIREYLQLLWLSYLYQQKESDEICFKGGTAIHFLFNSPRFSEDLDFSTNYSKAKIIKIVKQTEAGLQKELPGNKAVILYSGRNGMRFRWRFIMPEFRYPLVIRLDFSMKKNINQTKTASIMTRFPLTFSPIVVHLSAEEILAEKIRAMMMRAKGRDVFDFWFLLQKQTKINQNLVAKKLGEVGLKFNQKLLLVKVKNFPIKSLEQDLNKFLPRNQRKVIKILKAELLFLLADEIKRLSAPEKM